MVWPGRAFSRSKQSRAAASVSQLCCVQVDGLGRSLDPGVGTSFGPCNSAPAAAAAGFAGPGQARADRAVITQSRLEQSLGSLIFRETDISQSGVSRDNTVITLVMLAEDRLSRRIVSV